MKIIRFLRFWFRDDENTWDDVAAMIPVVGQVDWYAREREMRRAELR